MREKIGKKFSQAEIVTRPPPDQWQNAEIATICAISIIFATTMALTIRLKFPLTIGLERHSEW